MNPDPNIEYEPYPGDAVIPAQGIEPQRPIRSTAFLMLISALIVIGAAVTLSTTLIGAIALGFVLIPLGPIMGIILLVARARSNRQASGTTATVDNPAQAAAANFGTWSQNLTFVSSVALLAVAALSLISFLPGLGYAEYGGWGFPAFAVPTIGFIAIITAFNWYYNPDILKGEHAALSQGLGKSGLIRAARTLNTVTIWVYLAAFVIITSYVLIGSSL